MNWIGFWAGSSCHSARIEIHTASGSCHHARIWVHTASVCAILQHHQSSFIYWTSGLERFMCTQFNKLQKTFLLFVVYRGIKIISELNGTSSFNHKPNILKWQREQKALPLTWAGCGLKKTIPLHGVLYIQPAVTTKQMSLRFHGSTVLYCSKPCCSKQAANGS